MNAQDHATKRISVRPGTWEDLKRLRESGQTYDDVIVNLIREGNRNRLYDETDRIMSRGRFAELTRYL